MPAPPTGIPGGHAGQAWAPGTAAYHRPVRVLTDAWRARRIRLRPLAALTSCLLLVGLSAAGCADLGAEEATGSALGSAGYQDVNINVDTGSGLPSGGLVSVGYSQGPTGNEQKDARRAEKIVWDTLALRFGALEILKESGGCAGPVCESQSDEIASATYAQLTTEFGQRPHRLAVSPSGSFKVDGWLLLAGFWVIAAVIVAVVVVTTRVARRRRPGRPTSPGYPQGPAPPPWPPAYPPGQAAPPPPPPAGPPN
jgi:hypothetical protein